MNANLLVFLPAAAMLSIAGHVVVGRVVRSVRRWWERRNRDLSDLLRDRLASEDVYAEDLRRNPYGWCPLCELTDGEVFKAFYTIARHNRDLNRSARALAGLYLIPTEESS